MKMLKLGAAVVLGAALLAAQEPVAQPPAQKSTPPDKEEQAKQAMIQLPAGTQILLTMKNSVSSRNARPGDGVYLETSFPVVADGRVVIPAGTFVQGTVDSVKRAGRLKGRAEVLLHFTTLIYPNGYTVSLPASLESADSADTQKVKDKEGTVQAEGEKGKDATTMVTTGAATAGAGSLIGGLSSGSARGAGIGAGVGGAVGVLSVLLARGSDVRLENGSSVVMVLNRPIELDPERIESTGRTGPQPTRRGTRMEKQVVKPTTTTVNGVPLPR